MFVFELLGTKVPRFLVNALDKARFPRLPRWPPPLISGNRHMSLPLKYLFLLAKNRVLSSFMPPEVASLNS